MQLSRLAGLGEILLAVGQGCLAGRGEAGPGELLLAVGGGLLLGCDEARVASRTRGGLQPLPPFSFHCHGSHVLVCWPLLLSSSCLGRVGGSNHRWGPLAGPQCSVRTRWDRGVPVTVGEVAVSLQGRGCSWVGWPGWGRFCWLLGRGVLLVAVRPGRRSSC